jgi:hypothetical protein
MPLIRQVLLLSASPHPEGKDRVEKNLPDAVRDAISMLKKGF